MGDEKGRLEDRWDVFWNFKQKNWRKSQSNFRENEKKFKRIQTNFPGKIAKAPNKKNRRCVRDEDGMEVRWWSGLGGSWEGGWWPRIISEGLIRLIRMNITPLIHFLRPLSPMIAISRVHLSNPFNPCKTEGKNESTSMKKGTTGSREWRKKRKKNCNKKLRKKEKITTKTVWIRN